MSSYNDISKKKNRFNTCFTLDATQCDPDKPINFVLQINSYKDDSRKLEDKIANIQVDFGKKEIACFVGEQMFDVMPFKCDFKKAVFVQLIFDRILGKIRVKIDHKKIGKTYQHDSYMDERLEML
jgi:hypothetical protein